MENYWDEHRFLCKRDISISFKEFMTLTCKHTDYLVKTEHEAYLQEKDDAERANKGKGPKKRVSQAEKEKHNSSEMNDILSVD